MKKVALIILGVILVVWIIAALTKEKDTYITWTQAKELFAQCEVVSVTQTQSLDLTLGLKNGSLRYTKQPSIAAVGQEIANNQTECGNEIQFSTQ